jgi:hypothetical protein
MTVPAGYPTNGCSQDLKGGLSSHSPTIDLVGEVADELPGGTTVSALEDREVRGIVARAGSHSDQGPIGILSSTGVSARDTSGGVEDGVVGEESAVRGNEASRWWWWWRSVSRWSPAWRSMRRTPTASFAWEASWEALDRSGTPLRIAWSGDSPLHQ